MIKLLVAFLFGVVFISQGIAQSKELVFIDSEVENIDFLKSSLRSGADMITIENGGNAWEKIYAELSELNSSTIVHLVCKGHQGAIRLGGVTYTSESVKSGSLRILDGLYYTSKLLIYSSNLGEGDAGDEFLSSFSNQAPFEVWCSSTPIGKTELGGNWLLEKSSTENQAPESIFNPAVIVNYDHLLTF